MKEKVLLEIVYNSLLVEKSILVGIRNGSGVNEIEYDELVNALKELVIINKKRKAVPKKLALSFVDISNCFYASASLYSEEEFERLEDKANELNHFGQELFSD